MDAYNTAIKYLKDTFGENKTICLSEKGSKKLRRARNEKERKEIRSDEANYAPMPYNIPNKEDMSNYKIHLLLTQYQYNSILIKEELINALFDVGIEI
jgi:hypothetical protein